MLGLGADLGGWDFVCMRACECIVWGLGGWLVDWMCVDGCVVGWLGVCGWMAGCVVVAVWLGVCRWRCVWVVAWVGGWVCVISLQLKLFSDVFNIKN